jgi:hypothetical protein
MLLPRLLHFLWPFVFLAGCWRRRLWWHGDKYKPI